MTALATLEQLEPRLDWDLSDAEKADAEAALEHLSELARQHGRAWPEACPPLVRTTILTAAVRYMRNADGYTQSRAGDETLGWDGIGDKAGSPYFTDAEAKTIRTCAGAGGFYSHKVNAWGTSTDRLANPLAGRVPIDDGSKPFPLFAGEGPW